jgi:hypothetical protein
MIVTFVRIVHGDILIDESYSLNFMCRSLIIGAPFFIYSIAHGIELNMPQYSWAGSLICISLICFPGNDKPRQDPSTTRSAK